jgi:hypothetical protein
MQSTHVVLPATHLGQMGRQSNILCGIAFSYPRTQKLPYYREHDWAKEKSGDAIGERAANDADQYH